MSLKILHSADWHLDSPFSGFSGEQRFWLRKHQRKIPAMLGTLLQREHCDLVLLAGDLFDGNPGTDTVDALKTAFAGWKVPVLIAPGNHDYCGPGSIWNEEVWPENVHVFTGGLESFALPELDCRIYGAGYQSMDCPALLAGFQAEGPETYHIGLLHGDPMGNQSPYCPITAAQVRASGLTYLALGHIHKAGSFRAGDTLCAWPGCPMGRGWDETGEKGVYLVTVEDAAQLQWIRLNTPRFFEEKAEAAQLEEILPAAPCEDFYRVMLEGFGPVDLETVKKTYAHLPNLELIDRTEDPAALWEEAGEDTLRGVYFRMLQQISQEEPNAVLAAEISRKLLMGREVSLP